MKKAKNPWEVFQHLNQPSKLGSFWAGTQKGPVYSWLWIQYLALPSKGTVPCGFPWWPPWEFFADRACRLLCLTSQRVAWAQQLFSEWRLWAPDPSHSGHETSKSNETGGRHCIYFIILLTCCKAHQSWGHDDPCLFSVLKLWTIDKIMKFKEKKKQTHSVTLNPLLYEFQFQVLNSRWLELEYAKV